MSKSLPQPTKRPYSLDLDDLFAQASAAVRARGGQASRLGLELAAYLLFAATVIEFFDPKHIATRMTEAESPGVRSLDTLAAARQSLAVSPGMSLAYTQRFRAAWGLAAN